MSLNMSRNLNVTNSITVIGHKHPAAITGIYSMLSVEWFCLYIQTPAIRAVMNAISMYIKLYMAY